MIQQAAATVQSAEADLSRAQLDYKRYTALVTSDFASRQRFETADADSRKAEAALGKARAALVAEQSQLAVLGSQKREEEARPSHAPSPPPPSPTHPGHPPTPAPVAPPPPDHSPPLRPPIQTPTPPP